MNSLPASVTIVIAVLTIFLSFVVSIKYAIKSYFVRTRLLMTSFFCFIVITLTLSFWDFAAATLYYTIPAGIVGILGGYALGVRTERQKLMMQGLTHYAEHFAHVHFRDFKMLSWWTFVNFYTVMGALLLINLVGLTNVIYKGSKTLAIVSSIFGALLIGSIIPYLIHLWTIKIKHAPSSTMREV